MADRKMSVVSEEIQRKYELPLLHSRSLDETDAGFGPWDNIVEKSMVGTGIMKDGAIVDKEGKIYGINDSFHLKPEQIGPIVQAMFEDPGKTTIPDDGIKVADKTFKYLRSEPGDCMFGQDKDGGIIIRSTGRFLIIGIYNDERREDAKSMMADLQRYLQNI